MKVDFDLDLEEIRCHRVEPHDEVGVIFYKKRKNIRFTLCRTSVSPQHEKKWSNFTFNLTNQTISTLQTSDRAHSMGPSLQSVGPTSIYREIQISGTISNKGFP